MDKEIGQWLAIAGLIGVGAYCLYMKENTLAGVAIGAIAGFLKQTQGGNKNEKTSSDTPPAT